jgi:hypothetical protein
MMKRCHQKWKEQKFILLVVETGKSYLSGVLKKINSHKTKKRVSSSFLEFDAPIIPAVFGVWRAAYLPRECHHLGGRTRSSRTRGSLVHIHKTSPLLPPIVTSYTFFYPFLRGGGA